VSLAKTQELGRAAMPWRGTYLRLNALFLGFFFAFGAFYPLLSRFLEAKGFSGTEIGVLTAVGPIVAIVTQPVWGLLCDATQRPLRVLTVAAVMSGTIALGFLVADGFAVILVLLVGLHLFQSAIVPISDSLALRFARESGVSYGNIRLWGAVGFATAAFVAGRAADAFGLGVLFPLYAAALFASLWVVRRLPDQGEETGHVRLWRGLRDLLSLPSYALFVLSAFLVFGPINGNNVYFGLLYQALGGSVAGIGVAFLLFAGSEVIFMRTAGWFVRRWGLAGTLLFGQCGVGGAVAVVCHGTTAGRGVGALFAARLFRRLVLGRRAAVGSRTGAPPPAGNGPGHFRGVWTRAWHGGVQRARWPGDGSLQHLRHVYAVRRIDPAGHPPHPVDRAAQRGRTASGGRDGGMSGMWGRTGITPKTPLFRFRQAVKGVSRFTDHIHGVAVWAVSPPAPWRGNCVRYPENCW
jgi:Sugar phosphate permease